MMSKIDFMYNRSALDLSFSQQTRVISLNHLRITCYSHRSWCNCRFDCYKMFQRPTLDSGQRGEANIMGPDVFDQAIRTLLDEQSFLSVRKIAKRTCIPITTVWWLLTNSHGFIVKHFCWYLTNRIMQNWQQGYRCQTNSWQSSVRLSIKNDDN
jgi:hypothetical protein